jgi:hypothetical protein
MLSVSAATGKAAEMNPMTTARVRLERAVDLPAILDAAYDAFEDMLAVIRSSEEQAEGAFAAFVMSAASAANGRDAVAAAPSLPPAAPRDSDQAGRVTLPDGSAAEAAAAVAGLSQLLARRLTEAAALSADAGERVACLQATRHATDICALLGRTEGT